MGPHDVIPLTDGGVRLVPYRESPALVARALRWYADPEVLRGAGGPDEHPYDVARLRRMYAVLGQLGELYVIEVATGRTWLPVGDATLAPTTLPIVVGDADWRHRGVGRRTLALLVGRARALGWAALQVQQVWAENLASQRLYEGQGFRRVAAGTSADGHLFYRYALTLDPGGEGR
jgi:GNAT superfamily N-acetyltransferase